MTTKTRIEKDSMGEMTVPAGAYWGASAQRAVENFPISGYRFGRGSACSRLSILEWASARRASTSA